MHCQTPPIMSRWHQNGVSLFIMLQQSRLVGERVKLSPASTLLDMLLYLSSQRTLTYVAHAKMTSRPPQLFACADNQVNSLASYEASYEQQYRQTISLSRSHIFQTSICSWVGVRKTTPRTPMAQLLKRLNRFLSGT